MRLQLLHHDLDYLIELRVVSLAIGGGVDAAAVEQFRVATNPYGFALPFPGRPAGFS
jgi:hypothetical protein